MFEGPKSIEWEPLGDKDMGAHLPMSEDCSLQRGLWSVRVCVQGPKGDRSVPMQVGVVLTSCTKHPFSRSSRPFGLNGQANGSFGWMDNIPPTEKAETHANKPDIGKLVPMGFGADCVPIL